jgi:hypothetical protein
VTAPRDKERLPKNATEAAKTARAKAKTTSK